MDLKTVNKEKLYRSIAGVLFVIAGGGVLSIQLKDLNLDELSYSLNHIVCYIGYLLTGIFLIVPKNKATILSLVVVIVGYILGIFLPSFNLGLLDIFSILVSLSLLLFIIYKHKILLNKILCFIPLLLWVVGIVLFLLRGGWFDVIYALLTLATLFTCLWLTTFVKPKPVSEVYSQTNYAERLTAYKKLLDEGAITQEEYDAIKKRLI